MWLGVNVEDMKIGGFFIGVKGYVVCELGGIKLGFFGVVLLEMKGIIKVGKDIYFGDVCEVVWSVVVKLCEVGV